MELIDINNLNIQNFVSIESGCPSIVETVVCLVKYHNKGIIEHEIVIGYMDEYGDLVDMYQEENYGWAFNDCVIYWKYQTEEQHIKAL